jgi:Histidine kinase-, DNA gyrase B-, and HSP90-like ATPase
MSETATFRVDGRLTQLLGETYRSSEAAIKELVDNAWDADASNVWIDLPDPLSQMPITVRDDGNGMTALELRSQYMNIASDKRKRSGDRTLKLGRKIKGRKGIGKFAGLMVGGEMIVSSVARGIKSTLSIQKKLLVESDNDIESVELPFKSEPATLNEVGTTVILMQLDQRLNFPTAEKLREVLVYEYGRENNFQVHVGSVALSVEDISGTSSRNSETLELAGDVSLHFTISEAKRGPRHPGIIIKVDGKAVGRPQFFGLEDDEEIPQKLLKKVYGEIDLSGQEHLVTADWGAMVENSKANEEVREYVRVNVKSALASTLTKEMSLQKARLKKAIDARLAKLPENRREFAQRALNSILARFFDESDERIQTIIDVALDAMEFDDHYAILDNLNAASGNDVRAIASILQEFGIVELSTISKQARLRKLFLNKLEQLIAIKETTEEEMHSALAKNLWVFGRDYALLSSNTTLKSMIKSILGAKYDEPNADQRPDLFLGMNQSRNYTLIEFKRPSHSINRDDIVQAEKYRDALLSKLPNQSINILVIGKGLVSSVSSDSLGQKIVVLSFVGLVASARTELDWVLETLSQN